MLLTALQFCCVFCSSKNYERFLSSKLEELLKLMVEVLPTCHFSAKRYRLECLYFLIVHLSKVETLALHLITYDKTFFQSIQTSQYSIDG